nr:MAG TPA: hypothetical protein [Caudoviricetes sp.]
MPKAFLLCTSNWLNIPIYTPSGCARPWRW